MSIEKKLSLLEELFEEEEGALTVDTKLASVEEWNSLKMLSLIVLMEDEFGKSINAHQMREFVTVNDIVEFMG